MKDKFVKKQRDRTAEIKFITSIKSSQNPKDIFYVNMEERMQTYLLLILAGVVMVFYFMVA